MKTYKRVIVVLSILLLSAVWAYTHSGRTDSNGGHYNRKTGTYHYHGGIRKSSPRVNVLEQAKSPKPSVSSKQETIDKDLLPYPNENFIGERASPVIRIIDGDTVEIKLNSIPTKIRLIGVDTPETVHPQKPVEKYGKEASAFTTNLLLGESVYLRFDAEKTDKYGRMLAYLYRAPDGLFVNLEIIRQGYGHAYTVFPFKHIELFKHYQHNASKAGKGLWGTAANNTETVPHSPQVQLRQFDLKDVVPIDTTVYTTRTGSKYHRSNCRYLRKSKIPMDLSKAKTLYTPCSVCNPPR